MAQPFPGDVMRRHWPEPFHATERDGSCKRYARAVPTRTHVGTMSARPCTTGGNVVLSRTTKTLDYQRFDPALANHVEQGKIVGIGLGDWGSRVRISPLRPILSSVLRPTVNTPVNRRVLETSPKAERFAIPCFMDEGAMAPAVAKVLGRDLTDAERVDVAERVARNARGVVQRYPRWTEAERDAEVARGTAREIVDGAKQHKIRFHFEVSRATNYPKALRSASLPFPLAPQASPAD